MSSGSLFSQSRGAATRKVVNHDGWRLGLVLILVALASSMRGYMDVALCGVPVLFAVWRSGMRLAYVLSRFILIAPFGLGTAILLPLASGSGAWALVGLLLVKLSIANLGVTFLMGTTSVPELLQAMKLLRVPAPLTEMMGFTLRYISVLSEEAASMLAAQKARGLRASSFTNIRSYRRMGRLLGVLLVRALERSGRIHMAMLSRGYDSGMDNNQEAFARKVPLEKEEKPLGSHTRY
ncbi:MAG: cobalt transporter component CbiQ [Paenibacillaceae bacterium]|jgi:cobalt/nickel transport system permease protein|nr:cobalt transporter component CbiQ [Paenibacillaceae bacterium]